MRSNVQIPESDEKAVDAVDALATKYNQLVSNKTRRSLKTNQLSQLLIKPIRKRQRFRRLDDVMDRRPA